MRVNGILLFFSFCHDCNAVSRTISWAQCLPVVTAESEGMENLKYMVAVLDT